MKLGVLLLKSSVDQSVDFALDNDFASLEIVLENNLDSLTHADIHDIQRRCTERGVTFAAHAPSSDLRLGSYNLGIRLESIRQISRSIELVAGYANYLTIHSGFFPQYRSMGELERVMQSLNKLLYLAREANLTLCIENIHENSINQMQDYINLSDGETLKITLDLAHISLYGNYRHVSALFVLKPFIKNIHISDNDGKSDLHLAIGSGVLDFKAAFEFLKQQQYSGCITIEALSFEDALRSRDYLVRKYDI